MFLLSKHFGKSVRPDPDPTLEIKTDPDPTQQLMYIYCFELLKKTKSIFSMQKNWIVIILYSVWYRPVHVNGDGFGSSSDLNLKKNLFN